MKQFNNQFATQKLRENEAPGEEFIVNKVWDFLETKPFANPDYMPKFKTAEEIYNDFDSEILKKYSEFDWNGDTEQIHPREKSALQRRANYDKLAGTSDYMKHRQDPEYYEKEFQKAGTSDYFQRRGMDETSTTSGAGAYLPKATVKKKIDEVKKKKKDVEPKLAAGPADVYMKKKWGWKEAPSIPNRPSKGGFVYKQLFEALNENFSEGDHVKIVDQESRLHGMKAHIHDIHDDGTALVILDTPKKPAATVELDKLRKVELNENYSRFKKETKTRTNEQQLHAAMRLAEKKIHEANRILEYTAQLRSELNETKVNKNTQKLMEKITRGIAEAYGKMKKLK